MEKSRTKWRADRGSRALKQISQIEASIATLADEDLLDFADIVLSAPIPALAECVKAEMQRRNISL